MKRLLICLAISAGLCTISASHAAVRATWTGVVTAAVSRDFPIAPGDVISGTFCIDTALAPLDDDVQDPYYGSYYDYLSEWLLSRVRINGNEYPTVGAEASTYQLIQIADYNPSSLQAYRDSFDLDHSYYSPNRNEQISIQLRVSSDVFTPDNNPDVTWINGDSLSQSITWTPAKGTHDRRGSLTVLDIGGSATRTAVEVYFDPTSLTYTPIPEVSLADGIAEIPGVQVGGQVFKVEMRPVPGSNPLRFEVTAIDESDLLPGPGNATFNLATSELHIPAVKLPNGQHVAARLRLVPGTLFLELLSANFTDCS